METSNAVLQSRIVSNHDKAKKVLNTFLAQHPMRSIVPKRYPILRSSITHKGGGNAVSRNREMNNLLYYIMRGLFDSGKISENCLENAVKLLTEANIEKHIEGSSLQTIGPLSKLTGNNLLKPLLKLIPAKTVNPASIIQSRL